MKTADLYVSMLQGTELDPTEIQVLRDSKQPEDDYLEYKSGKLASNKAKLSQEVRQVLSGFANSSGGLLLLGFDEAEWNIDGFRAPGGIDGVKWVTDLARELSPYIAQRFVAQEIYVGDVRVLAVAVARADTLVPIIRNGVLEYFLRFYDKTLPAPSYLIQDLILGRRSRPEVEVTRNRINNLRRVEYDRESAFAWELVVELENNSLVWADDVLIGVIGYGYGRTPDGPLPRHLTRYIDIRPFDRQIAGWRTVHFYSQIGIVKPFDTIVTSLRRFELPLVENGVVSQYTWQGALYVVAKNSAPRWYSLALSKDRELTSHFVNLIAAHKEPSFENSFLICEPSELARPKVAVDWPY